MQGRYDLDREIGRGGMATVYLARDVRHHRNVALKVLNPDLGAVLGAERFLTEIQVTANLQHSNLLPLFDSGEAAGLLFYVMPFIEGESLRARLTRERQLPVDESLRITIAIASAVDYAHRHGVIHRDLKPENILLREGQPLVMDFGISLAVSNAAGARMTQTGISLGTPQYMSPEQAAGDRVIDCRADVYSLAAILYEMLTGEPPHVGSSTQAVVARVLTEKPRSVRAVRDTVPEHVDRAIQRGLAKVPADRWSSAHEFAEALVPQTPSAGHDVQVSRVVDSPRADVRRSRATRAAMWILPFVGIAAGAAGAVWINRQHEVDGSPQRYVLNLGEGERFLGGQGVPLALSPDGKLLAFVGVRSGRQSLFVRPLAELNARELPGTDGAAQPFFSPDGKWIGFHLGSHLKKISIDGGTAVPIAEVKGFWGAHWYADDRIVISIRGKLAVVSAQGGTPSVFAQPDSAASETAMRFPFVFADGKTVVYTALGSAGVARARIGVASIDGSRRRVLDVTGTDPLGVIEGRLIYANGARAIMTVPFDERSLKVGTPEPVIDDVLVGPDGPVKAAVSASGSLVYSSGGTLAQIVMAEPRGRARTIIEQPGLYAHPRLSPDGTKLALEIGGATGISISIFDIASGVSAPLTMGGGADINPEWSPDGKRVLYSSERKGTTKLMWQPADRSGSADVLYQSPRASIQEGMLSADGSTLVMRVDSPNAPNDVWYRRLSGDTTTRPLVSSEDDEFAPRISPDGKWVAYSSDESEVRQTYVTSLSGAGGRVPVSPGRGTTPVWSRDGRRLFYVGDEGLVAVTLAFAPTVHVVSRETLFSEDAVPRRPPNHAWFDVTPDGKQFVLLKNVGDPQLIVVHDWKYELRARSARPKR